MSRKRLPVWKTLLIMACDLGAIATGLLGAYWARFYSPLTSWFPIRNGFDPDNYLAILPLAILIWFVSLRLENLYRRRSRVFDFNVARRIATGSVMALLILIAMNFYHPDRTKVGDYSRLVTALMLAFVVSALVLNRIVLHAFFQWLTRKRGVGLTRAAVLGSGRIADQISSHLLRHPEYGVRPVGLILDRPVRDTQCALDSSDPSKLLPVLGMMDDLENILRRHRVDEVILAQADLDREAIPRLLIQCEHALAEFRIVPEMIDLLMSGMTVETLDGIPLLGIRETPLQGWNAALKRLIDVVAAGVGLVLTAPFIAVFAFMIRRLDGAPAFYVQERMGIDGHMFNILKLRSMVRDAEDGSGPTFAVDQDPRCTRVGAFLRRTHLDELPQLYNVLIGDMSLVGPRPERPYFVEQFRDNVPRYMARHKVKSGITGWAQVNGLCGLHGSIAERVKYDLYYIENWSLWLDVKILLMTLFQRHRPGPLHN